MTTKQDPYERGMEDYKKGIYNNPYPPKSKAAEKYKKAQDDMSFAEACDAGLYDDDGSV